MNPLRFNVLFRTFQCARAFHMCSAPRAVVAYNLQKCEDVASHTKMVEIDRTFYEGHTGTRDIRPLNKELHSQVQESCSWTGHNSTLELSLLSDVNLLRPRVIQIQQMPEAYYQSRLRLLMATLGYEGYLQSCCGGRGHATFFTSDRSFGTTNELGI